MPGAGGSATVSALSESAHCSSNNSWASSSTAIRLLAGRAVAALRQPPAPRIDTVMSDSGAEMKNCPGCGLNKALSQFHRNKSKPDAHASNCKTCANAGVQRKRQLKRERDGDGLAQHHRHPRRHAILDVAAAAHGGSDGELSAEARSPGGAAGGMGHHSFQAGGLADPHMLGAAGGFGGAAAAHLVTAHLAAASGAFQLQQQPLQHMLGGMLHQGIGSAASPKQLPMGSAANFGAHGVASAAGQPSLQEMLAGSYAQQHAHLAAQQWFPSAAGGEASPFIAAAAAAGIAVRTKQCRTCLLERPVDGNFKPALQEPDQLSANCRTCEAASDLLGYVQQEAEMAKATLQHVRAQYGDNSPATVVAFQAALETHQRYIKAMAARQPQQLDAAAVAPNSPVAAAVAALVAQQQQQHSLAAQLAQQQQAVQQQQAQQQQAHSELAQLAAARAQLAQQQQAAEQQAQQQQQLAAQQQRRQEQQLQRQHSHTVGRPSPQRGALALLPRAFSLPAGPAASAALPASRLSPAMTTPNPSPDAADLRPAQLPGQLTVQRPASAAADAAAAPAPAAGLQQPSPGTTAALQAMARGLSLSPPMSVGTPGVGPSDSTGSLAPGGNTSGGMGGSAAASPTVSVAPQHSASLVQPTCFACNKPAIRGFPLPMCSECQNAGPIIGSPAAAGAATTSEAPAAVVGALANEAGKLLSLGSLQDSLKSRSFSSTSSRSTAAQQILALGGFASDAELGAGLSGRLGSDTVSAARLDDKALRNAIAGAGLQLGRTTPTGGALTLAKQDSQLPSLPSAPPAGGPSLHTTSTSFPEAAAAAAGGSDFGGAAGIAAVARLPSSNLHSILQQAAARGKNPMPKQIATRRVS